MLRNLKQFSRPQPAQAAIEYMLLLAIVMIFVMVVIKSSLFRVHETSEVYYNRVAAGIAGAPPTCGDGVCNIVGGEDWDKCCADCLPCCRFELEDVNDIDPLRDCLLPG